MLEHIHGMTKAERRRSLLEKKLAKSAAKSLRRELRRSRKGQGAPIDYAASTTGARPPSEANQ